MTNLINRVLGLLKPQRAIPLPSPALPVTPPGAERNDANEPIRKAICTYIKGQGIEVGALHRPLALTGLAVSGIKYVDYMTEDQLKNRYPELGALPLVPVDIVDDGEVLGKIENASLDFIIGNHFIEHTRNPIGTLLCWVAKLKPGGVIFLAVPDKRFTFDRDRELTPLAHLITDHAATPAQRAQLDRPHFKEWATFVDKLPPAELDTRADFLMEINYSIHFHTFMLQSFLDIIHYMRTELRAPFVLTACTDVVPGGNEFLLVLTRI